MVSNFFYMPKIGSSICFLIYFINELYHLPQLSLLWTLEQTPLLGTLSPIPILSGSSVFLICVTLCEVSPPNMH